ncbi:unnamed protein product [Symbiodinium sp. KB8]|nr:unnamed protein product [Symbiodinium sp. KB8]
MAASADSSSLLGPRERWAVRVPGGLVGRVIGKSADLRQLLSPTAAAEGATIRELQEKSGCSINVDKEGQGGHGPVVWVAGAPQACAAAVVGVVCAVVPCHDTLSVQLSTSMGAQPTFASCEAAVSSLAALDGLTAQFSQDDPAEDTVFGALVVTGPGTALAPALSALADALWGVKDAFGVSFFTLTMPASAVGSLIGRGGANARELHALGADFDVPRGDRGRVGNVDVAFHMPTAAVSQVQDKVRSFLGSEAALTWRRPQVQKGALEAVHGLVAQLADGTLVSPGDITGALAPHAGGITPSTTSVLLGAIGDAYAAHHRRCMAALATEGTAPALAPAQEWLAQATAAVASVEASAIMAHPAVAAAAERGAQGGSSGGETQCLFFPSPGAHARLLRLLRRAVTSLDIAVFSITDNAIADAIAAAAGRGVAVRLISDDEQAKSRGSDILRLAASGIPTRLDASPTYHMHHKFAVVDGRLLATGSYNWTQQAHHGNAENVLVVRDPMAVREYQAAFDALWDACVPAQGGAHA